MWTTAISPASILESLALQREDLPEGFVLEFEETDTVENGSLYLAKYSNHDISGDDLETGVLNSTVDIVIVVYDSEQDAVAFLGVFESMTSEDLVAYTQQQLHHPVGEEFEGLEQVGVEARILSFRQVGDGSVAWETIERIYDQESGIELAFHDYSAIIRQGRAVAIVALGATQQAPDSDEFDALVEVQNVRLKRGLGQ